MSVSRETIQVKCDELGVEFCYHSDSFRMKVSGWYHKVVNGNPWFNRSVYVTQHPYIFIPDGVPDPLSDWLVINHELVHWTRQRDMGLVSWTARYLVSWRFREEEERIAFLRDIKSGRMTVGQAVERLRAPLYGSKTSIADLTEWFDRQLSIRVPDRPR